MTKSVKKSFVLNINHKINLISLLTIIFFRHNLGLYYYSKWSLMCSGTILCSNVSSHLSLFLLCFPLCADLFLAAHFLCACRQQ